MHKGPVSEHLSVVNVLTGPKNCWNLQDSTLILIFRHSAKLLNDIDLQQRCFPVNFVKFLRAPFLHNTSKRLLLKFGDGG